MSLPKHIMGEFQRSIDYKIKDYGRITNLNFRNYKKYLSKEILH